MNVVGSSGYDRRRARIPLVDVFVDRLDRAAVFERLKEFAIDGGQHHVVTVNLDFLRAAQTDEAFRDIINRADLAVADGMPVVWLSQLGGRKVPERLTAFDLIDMACDIATGAGIGVFLLGAAPGVADAAAAALRNRHSGLRIVGTHVGFPADADEALFVGAVRRAGRCILLVALGAPKQDKFIHAHLTELDVPIAIGVGGAFDVLAGTIRRAPGVLQRLGFEWTWRMAMEPRRLWRRYLVEDVPFLGVLTLAAIRESVSARGSRA